MSDDEILGGIVTVARKYLDYDGPVEREMLLVESFGLDSIRLAALVVELESHFGVVLDPGEEDGLQTVGDLLEFLKRARR